MSFFLTLIFLNPDFVAVGFSRRWRSQITTIHRELKLTATILLNYFRRQRNDLHILALAKLASDGSENASAARLTLSVQQHNGIFIEANIAAVLAARFFFRPHDHG